MPARVVEDDDGPTVSVIHNHIGKGLCIYDKNQLLHSLSNFSIKFVSDLRDIGMDMVGYLFALKVGAKQLNVKHFKVFTFQIFPANEVAYVYIGHEHLNKPNMVERCI